MRRALFVPPFGQPAHPGVVGDLADAAGWDGVFLWDHVLYCPPANTVLGPGPRSLASRLLRLVGWCRPAGCEFSTRPIR